MDSTQQHPRRIYKYVSVFNYCQDFWNPYNCLSSHNMMSRRSSTHLSRGVTRSTTQLVSSAPGSHEFYSPNANPRCYSLHNSAIMNDYKWLAYVAYHELLMIMNDYYVYKNECMLIAISVISFFL